MFHKYKQNFDVRMLNFVLECFFVVKIRIFAHMTIKGCPAQGLRSHPYT